MARTAAYRDTMYRGQNPDSASLPHNARKLANRAPIKRRLAELAEFSAKLAGVDSGWALVKLKQLADAIEGFNLDDYLGEADEHGVRVFKLGDVTPEKMALLSELSVKQEDGKVEIKLKGPAKVDMVGPIALMARIAGWEAPKKIAATTPEGKAITLADLIGASYAQQRPPQGALPAPEKAA